MTITAGVSAYQPVDGVTAPGGGRYHRMRRSADGTVVLLWRATAAVPEADARVAAAAMAALPGRPAMSGVAAVLDAGIDPARRPWLAVANLTTLAAALAESGTPQPSVVGRIASALGRSVDALRGGGLPVAPLSPHRVFFDRRAAVWLAPPLPAELFHLDEPDPSYAAPEVLAGADPSPASDAYGLAAAVFALLAGVPPHGDDPTEAALRALTGDAPELPRRDIAPAVRDLIRRGLARDPAERPAVAVLGEGLAVTLGQQTSHAARPDPAHVATLPPTNPSSESAPQPLGSRYLLEGVVGSGVSGRVWRGRRRADGSVVAVKVLREEYSRDSTVVVRFLRERATLRALDHPHLVRVHDLVAEGDTLAIVMELVDGEDLRAVTRRAPLSPEESVAVLTQVAGALAAVHAGGVVHRDVKPENVLVARGPEGPWAWLTDFGLARATDGPALTRMSQLVGTPAYVAPELVAGRPPSPAGDVYALGIMAYELLAGRRPFDAPTTAALLRAHLDTEPARPAGLPDQVWSVLAACLAKDPEQRPSASGAAAAFASLRGRMALLPPPTEVPATAASASFGTTNDTLTRDSAARHADSGESPTTSATDTASPAASQLSAVESRPGTGSSALSMVGQPTIGASRPIVERPATAPVRKRRRGLWIAAVVTCLVVGITAGIVASLNQPEPLLHNATPSTPAGPAPKQVFLPVTATSPKAGTVRLQFTDAEKMEGFASYVIYRDVDLYGQVSAADAPPYLIRNVDTTTEHCYRVAALVTTDASPPPTPGPACVVANGRPQ